MPALGMPDGRAAALTLDDLDRHDAIRLFLTRAREARPGMAVDRHAIGHVVSICLQLDGMPLALELAAARLRTLPLATVAESIGEIFRWKGKGAPIARHTTLRASIEWSFQLISPDEQQLLIALATFRSPFDANAAVAVTRLMDGSDDASEQISRLADVGLLQLDDDNGQYRMLNTVRQFCLERGAERGGLAQAERAHAHFFADWCDDVGAGRMGLERRRFLRRMPDVVAAMAWARDHDHRAAFRMCRGLAPVRSTLGQHADFDTTWQWLTGLHPDQRDALWADAVAGLLATATGTSLVHDTAPAEEAVLGQIADGPGRARSWLERGRAMVPARIAVTVCPSTPLFPGLAISSEACISIVVPLSSGAPHAPSMSMANGVLQERITWAAKTWTAIRCTRVENAESPRNIARRVTGLAHESSVALRGWSINTSQLPSGWRRARAVRRRPRLRRVRRRCASGVPGSTRSR